jgi:hypothetical protein
MARYKGTSVTREKRTTRALTDGELIRLRHKLVEWNLSRAAAARRIGVTDECLAAALDGFRIQYAKRCKMLETK